MAQCGHKRSFAAHSKFYHPAILANAPGRVEKKYFSKRDNKSALSPKNRSRLYSDYFSIEMARREGSARLKANRSLTMRDGVCLAKPKLF